MSTPVRQLCTDGVQAVFYGLPLKAKRIAMGANYGNGRYTTAQTGCTIKIV
jgi:hypothetical protein